MLTLTLTLTRCCKASSKEGLPVARRLLAAAVGCDQVPRHVGPRGHGRSRHRVCVRMPRAHAVRSAPPLDSCPLRPYSSHHHPSPPLTLSLTLAPGSESCSRDSSAIARWPSHAGHRRPRAMGPAYRLGSPFECPKVQGSIASPLGRPGPHLGQCSPFLSPLVRPRGSRQTSESRRRAVYHPR